ncbi:MAG: methyltransferase domain-containing protein, partial [Chthoniobacterales bacterium]
MADNIYESDRLVREYLLFHYGSAEDTLPWSDGPRGALGFAERCVSELLDCSGVEKNARALDVGCAVGRSSFELARHCRSVTGIDSSRAFVAAATKVGRERKLAYEFTIEGERTAQAVARLPEGVDSMRVAFE